MWAATVLLVRPEKLRSIIKVCAIVSSVTVAEPVAVEATGGFSFAGLSDPENVIVAPFNRPTRVTRNNETVSVRFKSYPPWFSNGSKALSTGNEAQLARFQRESQDP